MKIPFITHNNGTTEVRVLDRKGVKPSIVTGHIIERVRDDLAIRYVDDNGVENTYIEDYNNRIAIYEGFPMYEHRNGSSISPVYNNDTGSKALNSLFKSNFAQKGLQFLEELKTPNQIPWRKIIIIGLIAVVAIYLWQSGFIPKVLGDVMPK